MPDNRGSIFAQQAYAQGKMLDHSQWKTLPRRITPSDVDMCFDNNGELLLCELSSKCNEWNLLQVGQRRLYESFVSKGNTIAALLKHSVPIDKQINTFSDIESFQVMLLLENKIETTELYDGCRWPRFVFAWFGCNSAVLSALCDTAHKTKNAPTTEDIKQQLQEAWKMAKQSEKPFIFVGGNNQRSLWS